MVIILFLWIIIGIIIILSLISQLQLRIYNIEQVNYVKVKYLMFTVDFDYERFIKTLKRFGVTNNLDLKSQLSLYQTLNPIFKDMVKQTVVDKAKFYKYIDDCKQTYKIITFYLLS